MLFVGPWGSRLEHGLSSLHALQSLLRHPDSLRQLLQLLVIQVVFVLFQTFQVCIVNLFFLPQLFLSAQRNID